MIQGEGKAQVKIYTEVDGEVVTDIDEPARTTDGVQSGGEVTGPKARVDLPAGQGQAGKSVEVNVGSSETEKSNPVIAFLNKIFNYVLSILNI